ncbi:hypothetical protein CR513_27188, partial [Mucuna pruriens]
MPVLDGKNFEQWCVKMGVMFGFQEVLETVRNDIQEVEVGAIEVQRVVYMESKKKDYKALFLIHQCDLQRMLVEELQNSLEIHEQRLLERSSMRAAAQALQAQNLLEK